jgi:hypothetical protein
MAMLWFFVVTTIYLPVKYMFSDGGISTIVYFAIYLLMVIVGEYFINLGTTSAMCGSTQWGTAISVTIIPWLVIFGLLNVMLKIFPGWLTPFSNTIGYAVTKIMGVGELFGKILQDEDMADLHPETKKALARIYSDKSLIINEIPATVSGFTEFWRRLSPLMNTDAPPADSDAEVEEMLVYKETPEGQESVEQSLAYQLYSYVRLKNIISEYVWYMLTGALVTSVGYNYIIGAGCELSVAEMQQRHDEYMDKEAELAEAQGRSPPRVYRSSD